jgi:hypothetical protein
MTMTFPGEVLATYEPSEHRAIQSAISHSNLTPEKKSALRRFYEKTWVQDKMVAATPYARHGLHVVRHGTEAAGVGLALGYLAGSREKGLDTPVGPIDGAVAIAGLVGSMVLANDPRGFAQDALQVGTAALAILTYRKSEEWKRRKGSAIPSAHGDIEDRIMAMAKDLGL